MPYAPKTLSADIQVQGDEQGFVYDESLDKTGIYVRNRFKNTTARQSTSHLTLEDEFRNGVTIAYKTNDDSLLNETGIFRISEGQVEADPILWADRTGVHVDDPALDTNIVNKQSLVTHSGQVLANAKTYTDTVAVTTTNTAVANAKTYTDTVVANAISSVKLPDFMYGDVSATYTNNNNLLAANNDFIQFNSIDLKSASMPVTLETSTYSAAARVGKGVFVIPSISIIPITTRYKFTAVFNVRSLGFTSTTLQWFQDDDTNDVGIGVPTTLTEGNGWTTSVVAYSTKTNCRIRLRIIGGGFNQILGGTATGRPYFTIERVV